MNMPAWPRIGRAETGSVAASSAPAANVAQATAAIAVPPQAPPATATAVPPQAPLPAAKVVPLSAPPSDGKEMPALSALSPKELNDMQWLLEQFGLLSPSALSLARSRKFFFCYQSEPEQIRRLEEFEELFLATLLHRPRILKTSIWASLRAFYKKQDMEVCIQALKNDGFAFRQCIMWIQDVVVMFVLTVTTPITKDWLLFFCFSGCLLFKACAQSTFYLLFKLAYSLLFFVVVQACV